MLIKKECISTNNSLIPIIHQGNLQKHSHSVIVLNTCHIEYFVNMCWGWVTCRTLRILHILGKKINLKARWSLSNKHRHETRPRFYLASNFCGKHENPVIRLFFCLFVFFVVVFFCGKNKNPGWHYLVLALLLQKLSSILSPN